MGKRWRGFKYFFTAGPMSERCPCHLDQDGRELKHAFKPRTATKFMDCSDHYMVTYQCIYCDEQKTYHFETHSSLIRLGVPKEEIDKIARAVYYTWDWAKFLEAV